MVRCRGSDDPVGFPRRSLSKRAHANAVSRPALGLAEIGKVETTIVCHNADLPPPWLPPEVRINWLGVDNRLADGLIAPCPAAWDNAVRSCGLYPSSAALVSDPMPAFSGCPVITADSLGGGHRFMTPHCRYGVLVPPGRRGSPGDGNMLRPEVRAHYSAPGRRRIEALSPMACASMLVEFLSEHLGLARWHIGLCTHRHRQSPQWLPYLKRRRCRCS